MGMIEGFRIQNFRAIKNIKMGKLWNEQTEQPLTPMTTVIGKNGVGKSSIFDAFGFLADCLKNGVEDACNMHERGGYKKIHSKEQSGPIAFEIYYRENNSSNSRPITYEVEIGLDKLNRPYVVKERLRQRRMGEPYGKPYSFLHLINGKGVVWKGKFALSLNEDENTDIKSLKKEAAETKETEYVELEDPRKLGIATLGALKQHPRISSFRKFIEGWYLSYFTPDAARELPMAGPQKQLNVHGDNLSNVVQFMERENGGVQFQNVLAKIASKIPGIKGINTEETDDGRLLLRFYAEGFKEPFFAQQMSDGTLKVFAYLLLLASPIPAPLICIEEPENGLYHKLLSTLVQEFREYATSKKNSSQIFITTHQPYLVDNLKPEEVWILEKGKDGFSVIHRASEDKLVVNMVKNEFPLGRLWYSDYLDER